MANLTCNCLNQSLDDISIQVYIYIYKLASLVCTKDMPLMWKHANLEDLKLFLKEEHRRGNFTPLPGLSF